MELQASEHEICDETTTHQKSSTMVINLSLLDESWLSMQIGTQKHKQKKTIILVEELTLDSRSDMDLLNIGW